MKVFNLRCQHGHPFEGWFKSHEAFDDQQGRGLLECPVCGSTEVEKTLSAPRLNLSMVTPSPEQAPALTAALKLVREMLAASEDVGDRFAEEARALHAKESPSRSIHGNTSLETAQELMEEGIPVVALPFPGLIKNPLQ
jgi:hypothetical protein